MYCINVCQLAKAYGFDSDAVFIEIKVDFSGEDNLDGFKEVINRFVGLGCC